MPNTQTIQRQVLRRSGSVNVFGHTTSIALRLFSFKQMGAWMPGVGWEKGFASVQHLAAVLNIDYPIY